jgi:hypothetical protein
MLVLSLASPFLAASAFRDVQTNHAAARCGTRSSVEVSEAVLDQKMG